MKAPSDTKVFSNLRQSLLCTAVQLGMKTLDGGADGDHSERAPSIMPADGWACSWCAIGEAETSAHAFPLRWPIAAQCTCSKSAAASSQAGVHKLPNTGTAGACLLNAGQSVQQGPGRQQPRQQCPSIIQERQTNGACRPEQPSLTSLPQKVPQLLRTRQKSTPSRDPQPTTSTSWSISSAVELLWPLKMPSRYS